MRFDSIFITIVIKYLMKKSECQHYYWKLLMTVQIIYKFLLIVEIERIKEASVSCQFLRRKDGNCTSLVLVPRRYVPYR